MKRHLPITLILFRLFLAPLMIILAIGWGIDAKIPLLTALYLGLFSDIFDGIIARKLNVSSANLRRLDSQVDMLFWLSAGFSIWLIHPELIKENMVGIIGLFIMEGLCYGVSLLKFRRETCTHAYLSKLWGITLLIAFTAMIGFGTAGIPFNICLAVGVISHLDRILITLILPHWTHDIPSAYHALKIRQGKTIKRHSLFNG